jgi:hypothetical protein
MRNELNDFFYIDSLPDFLKAVSNYNLTTLTKELFTSISSDHVKSLNATYQFLIENLTSVFKYYLKLCFDQMPPDVAKPLDPSNPSDTTKQATDDDDDDIATKPAIPADSDTYTRRVRMPGIKVGAVYYPQPPPPPPPDTDEIKAKKTDAKQITDFIAQLDYFAKAKEPITDLYYGYLQNFSSNQPDLLEKLLKKSYKLLIKIKILLDALNTKSINIKNTELYTKIVEVINAHLKSETPVEENQESENTEVLESVDASVFDDELLDSPEDKSSPKDYLKELYDKIIGTLDEKKSTPIGEIIKTTTPFPVFKYETFDLSFLMKDGDKTFQNNYLSKYDIKNNLWLILLYTIHHLGANKVITKHIRINPDPSQQRSYPQEQSFDIGEYFNTDKIKRKKELEAQLELIKDHYLTDKPLEIKSARVIILAATNEDGKQGQVIQTFRAAQSLARLTGKACIPKPISSSAEEDEFDQFGGGYDDFNHLFKKSYHNYIKSLNRNYKKSLK